MGRMVLLCIALATPGLIDPGAQADRPLPDRDTFLSEAQKRLASNTLRQSRYTFRERVTQVGLNPFGRLGTGPVEVYEVYPLPDSKMTYRRLVERDGVKVSPAAVAEQDREYLGRFRPWRAQLTRGGQTEQDALAERQSSARDKERAQATELTSLFDFAIEGRDTLEGQPAILVSIKPKPNARPRTREGRVASSFAGRAWIHEHDREVMRVEAEAQTDTSFGFGLIARLYKGATAVFVRRRVGDSWLPMETRVNGAGRALLVRKASFNYLREYSEYRPFDWAELPSILAASGSR